ncbi:MAG: Do family serine endopeptidase [Deltaproteobacteria bacterium]|nr:Do family serine endopeptidase [Deltaproteobacteria bacterium]
MKLLKFSPFRLLLPALPCLAALTRNTLAVGTLTLGALALGGCGPAQPPLEPGLGSAAGQAAGPAAAPTLRVAANAGVPTNSSIADLVEHVAPMVVNIITVQTMSGRRMGPSPSDYFSREGRPRPMPHQRKGAGTGFIIDPAGYVVTNAHVVRGADEVTVRLRNDKQFTAEVVGRDRKLDLALLKIEGASELPAVTLGDSNALRVGEQIIAVGNPFGLGHTVTMGIVSAKARSIGAGPYDEFIQTDASINPGNSGGPLFNLRGEVVGIATAIRAGADGISFAIPIHALKQTVSQLKDRGYVERGKLGLAFQPVTRDIAQAIGLDQPQGALVSDVLGGSAAAKAGIKPGDVILAVQGVKIRRAEELPRNVARHAPGSTIDLELFRGGRSFELKATLDKLENDDRPPTRPTGKRPPAAQESMLGIEVENSRSGGVRIVALIRPHDELRPGDVITEVNGTRVSNVAALRTVLKDASPGDAVLFKIERNGRSRYVGVPLKG